MDSDRFVLIGRHRDGSLESHAEATSNILLVVYCNDHPDFQWIALCDVVDGWMIAGEAFDKLVHEFSQAQDRECADESRHERGLRVPADDLYGSKG